MKRLLSISLTTLLLATLASAQGGRRAMTFMDVINMKQLTSRDLSPDGSAVVLAVSAVDWRTGRSFSDIYLAPTDGTGMRQMTFTRDKSETAPKWARDGKSFAFLSDRESAAGSTDRKNQLYLMRPDGGEAVRLTEDRDGLDRFDFSPDGKWIAYTAGKPGERQLFLLPANGGPITTLTKHETGINEWEWGPESGRIYFSSPDSADRLEKQRIEKKFDVRISNAPAAAKNLWAIEIGTKRESQLTAGGSFSVGSFVVSKDGAKIGLRTTSPERYATGEEAEVYLLDVASKGLTRVTENRVGEGQLVFSPDSQWLAFTAPEGFTYMRNTQIYIVSSAGGEVKALVKEFDGDAGGVFWARDGRTVYFTAGVGVNQQLYSMTPAGGKPRRVTDVTGVIQATRDADAKTDHVLLTFMDPYSPVDLYVAQEASLSDRKSWKKVTDLNPQVRGLELGQYETVRWESTDGASVEGILVKPLGYRQGERYPLIVQLHGGPAGAYVNSFAGSYGTYVHILAANGYAVFQPNYRGSTNYGEKFKMQIAGNYFRLGYDDIITGVDHLIGRGIADPDKLGMMGWSAGGHWSNWTLTHTDRFKAISSGAGAVNWVSMYAQTDVQVPREFYFKGRPYDNWEHYIEVSPIRYIKNAKTPTLIHVGEADPRVPMPQSLELHMALKKLGVPTELIVYPGMPHSITNPRYQLVKMVSEFGWFERWIKGKQRWLDWGLILDTLKDDDAKAKEKAEAEAKVSR